MSILFVFFSESSLFFLRNAQICRKKKRRILCVHAAENRFSSRNGFGRQRRETRRKGAELSARKTAAYCRSVVIIVKMYIKKPVAGLPQTLLSAQKKQYLVVFLGSKNFFTNILTKLLRAGIMIFVV